MNKTPTLRKKDLAAIWHPYTRKTAIESEQFPVIDRAKGIHLFDTDGKKWVDAISSWWCCNLGHSNRQITNAIKKQISKLQHSILGNMSHTPAIELAWMITRLFPDKQSKVLFCSDGSSSVDAALKIAVQYWSNVGKTQKNRFISFSEAYHGDTVGAISAGFLPVFHKHYKDLCFKVRRVESPCCGKCSFGLQPDTCRLQCFTVMRNAIKAHASTTAAVIIEPLCQAAGGMRMYSPRYLKSLAQECRRNKVLLIVDEIAMGMFRTGKMFAFDHAGIAPDITCIGKGLSGGYLPISAVIAKNSIFRTFTDSPVDKTFYHGHTFGGNPIACAAAIEALKIYSKTSFAKAVGQKAKIMRDAFSRLLPNPAIADLRTLGLIAAVEFKGKLGLIISQEIRRRMLDGGVLIRPLGNVVYLMPPLVISCTELKRLCSVFVNAINISLNKGVKRVRKQHQ